MIKRILLSFILLFLFIKPAFAQITPTFPPKVQENLDTYAVGERIKNFDSKININKDGSINVTERIYYIFDTERHGIFRNIPFTKYKDNKRYDLDFIFGDVTDENGQKYTVKKYKEGEQWVLKVGDPNNFVSGNKIYIINYKVKGAIGYFEDHDELYWNTTGNGWGVPIQKAKSTISLPTTLSREQIKLKCYTGPYGSNAEECTATTDGQTSTFTNSKLLNSYEGLTTVVGFPKNIVAVLLPVEYVPFFERWYGKIVLALIVVGVIFWYIILPFYLVFKWYRDGRDPYVGRPITAGFDPPVGAKNQPLTPAETGSLIDESVETRDIFSSIVHLAQRGYLKIVQTDKKDFLFHYTNKPKKGDTLLPFEETLLDGIFSEGRTSIELKNTKLYTTVNKVKEMLYKNMVDDGFFTKNPQTTRNIYYAIGFVSLFTLNLITAFIAFLFGRNMPKKTLFGAQQANVGRGLKNFLNSQERQLNYQGNKQMFFERLLPFAVAFGVEKAWAKRFESFDLKNPDWYESSSGSNFNTALFASSLHNSYNSFSVSSTPPSSSSSGFGGGGFSGGGGGGGGGGSW